MPEALLFSVTAVACAWSALRVAARWAGGGWARVASAAVLVGALAALVPPLCGLTSLGTSAWALAAASLAVALPAGFAAGRADPIVLPALGRRSRAAAGAAAAFAGAHLAALLARPEVRTDGYHLTEVVRWLHEGRPGSVELVVQEWPAGAYPLANELILTWACGIARSFAPVLLLTSAYTVLLAGSALALLRARGLGAAAAGLGAAAVVLVGATTGTLDSVATDLPSLAWLAVAAALLAAREPERRHLGPALIALGLAVGTKTTAALAGLGLLAMLAWPLRHRLRRPDALAAAAAGAAVALPWPIRNLIEHGSPMWPFSSLGSGDPVPYVISELQASFLDAPAAAVRMYWRYSTGDLATAALLLGGAVAVALLARRRDVVCAAALAVAGMLVWAASPITGPPPEVFASSAGASIRYALPSLGVAAVAVALGLRGRARVPAAAVLVLCCAGCLYLLPLRMFMSVEAFAAAAAVAVAGGAVGWRGLPRLAVRPVPAAGWRGLSRPTLRPAAAAALAVVCIAGACLFSADRFMWPTAGEGAEDRALLGWLDAQPGFASGSDPVLVTWRPDGRMSGPRLRHDVRLVPHGTPCEEIRRLARGTWFVALRRASFSPYQRHALGEDCLPGVRPDYADVLWAVYDLTR